MRTFESEPMQIPIPRSHSCSTGAKPSPEVGLGRQADADSRAGIGDQIQLESVGVGGVHDGRSGPEAAAIGQQLDRPQALFS